MYLNVADYIMFGLSLVMIVLGLLLLFSKKLIYKESRKLQRFMGVCFTILGVIESVKWSVFAHK